MEDIEIKRVRSKGGPEKVITPEVMPSEKSEIVRAGEPVEKRKEFPWKQLAIVFGIYILYDIVRKK